MRLPRELPAGGPAHAGKAPSPWAGMGGREIGARKRALGLVPVLWARGRSNVERFGLIAIIIPRKLMMIYIAAMSHMTKQCLLPTALWGKRIRREGRGQDRGGGSRSPKRLHRHQHTSWHTLLCLGSGTYLLPACAHQLLPGPPVLCRLTPTLPLPLRPPPTPAGPAGRVCVCGTQPGRLAGQAGGAAGRGGGGSTGARRGGGYLQVSAVSAHHAMSGDALYPLRHLWFELLVSVGHDGPRSRKWPKGKRWWWQRLFLREILGRAGAAHADPRI